MCYSASAREYCLVNRQQLFEVLTQFIVIGRSPGCQNVQDDRFPALSIRNSGKLPGKRLWPCNYYGWFDARRHELHSNLVGPKSITQVQVQLDTPGSGYGCDMRVNPQIVHVS